MSESVRKTDAILQPGSGRELLHLQDTVLAISDTDSSPFLIIKANGELWIDPKLSADEAARKFWDAVIQMNPYIAPKREGIEHGKP